MGEDAAARKARQRERDRAAGLTEALVKVHHTHKAAILELAATMREAVTVPLLPLRMTGRCASGAEPDGGAIFHAVPEAERYRWGKALCGAKPGRRGNGWDQYPGGAVTCPRCLKKTP
jgi:hypothetical protein